MLIHRDNLSQSVKGGDYYGHRPFMKDCLYRYPHFKHLLPTASA